MSDGWTRDGSLDWRRTPTASGVRLDVRDRTRITIGAVCGGGLVVVLAWALVARLDDASTPSLMVHGLMTLILAAFTASAVWGRTWFEVGEQLTAQGAPMAALDEVEDVVVIRRGGYAGLAIKRTDGVVAALPPVFLSKAKAEQVRAGLVEAIDARRGASLTGRA